MSWAIGASQPGEWAIGAGQPDVAAAGGANPKGPLHHPLRGPLAGPILCLLGIIFILIEGLA